MSAFIIRQYIHFEDSAISHSIYTSYEWQDLYSATLLVFVSQTRREIITENQLKPYHVFLSRQIMVYFPQTFILNNLKFCFAASLLHWCMYTTVLASSLLLQHPQPISFQPHVNHTFAAFTITPLTHTRFSSLLSRELLALQPNFYSALPHFFYYSAWFYFSYLIIQLNVF